MKYVSVETLDEEQFFPQSSPKSPVEILLTQLSQDVSVKLKADDFNNVKSEDIAKALNANSFVTSLTCNHIGSHHFPAIMRVIVNLIKSNQLEQLSINYCALATEQGRLIEKALTHNRSLTKILLKEVPLHKELQQSIEAMVNINHQNKLSIQASDFAFDTESDTERLPVNNAYPAFKKTFSDILEKIKPETSLRPKRFSLNFGKSQARNRNSAFEDEHTKLVCRNYSADNVKKR